MTQLVESPRIAEQYWTTTKRYARHHARALGVPFDEAISEASIALLKCERRFDPARGAKFETMLYLAIYRSLLDYRKKQKRREGHPPIGEVSVCDPTPLPHTIPPHLMDVAERILHGERISESCPFRAELVETLRKAFDLEPARPGVKRVAIE